MAEMNGPRDGGGRPPAPKRGAANSSVTKSQPNLARYAAVAAMVVMAFFAAYSYALGSATGQAGYAGGQAAPAYDEYGNPVPVAAQPAIGGGAAAGGAAGGGCCGSGGGAPTGGGGAVAGGGGCCGGGGPQEEIRKKATQTGDTQVIEMTVNGNYDPNVIEAKAGVPLTFKIDHPSPGGCDQYLVFPDFGVSQELPPNGKTEITITPDKPGTYRFTCGMGMLNGTLIVQ